MNDGGKVAGGGQADPDHRGRIDAVGAAHGIAAPVLPWSDLPQRNGSVEPGNAHAGLSSGSRLQREAQLRSGRDTTIGIDLKPSALRRNSRDALGGGGNAQQRDRGQHAQRGSLTEQMFFHHGTSSENKDAFQFTARDAADV